MYSLPEHLRWYHTLQVNLICSFNFHIFFCNVFEYISTVINIKIITNSNQQTQSYKYTSHIAAFLAVVLITEMLEICIRTSYDQNVQLLLKSYFPVVYGTHLMSWFDVTNKTTHIGIQRIKQTVHRQKFGAPGSTHICVGFVFRILQCSLQYFVCGFVFFLLTNLLSVIPSLLYGSYGIISLLCNYIYNVYCIFMQYLLYIYIIFIIYLYYIYIIFIVYLYIIFIIFIVYLYNIYIISNVYLHNIYIISIVYLYNIYIIFHVYLYNIYCIYFLIYLYNIYCIFI